MKYYHVDVFSNKKFSGNGLTIFPDAEKLDKSFMQTLTQEMRQFESIFFHQTNTNSFRASIFTTEEELDFAGHPIIGAAAMIHDLYASEKEENIWTFELNSKSVEVLTTKKEGFYSAKMNQGQPIIGEPLSEIESKKFLSYLNLSIDDTYCNLPLQVISTGLPYLILPVKAAALAKVKVIISDLEATLETIGAKFFYVLDVDNKEGRTWDNFGLVEDIATGSAAGPVGAYLIQNKIAAFDTEIILNQGKFLNRPSIIKITVKKNNEAIGDVFVEGDVVKIAKGELIL